MAWYKTGLVSVENGQTSVTGTGTKFASNTRVGDGFRGPDGEWYEIVNIASETTLAIYPQYQGPTISESVNYMVAPLQGYNKESADRLRAITDQFKDLDAEVAAAAASASAAKASENAAKTSETNAASSATSASNSASTATQKATDASNSASAASSSANTATTKASEASNSANTALTQADRAKTEADRATQATDGKQPLSANLTAFSGLSGAADRLPYFTGAGALSLAAITAKARTVLAFTTNAQWQSELGLVPVASATDNTLGRLMTVGFIGLGGALGVPLPASNANVALPSGSCYATPATWTGSPYTGTDGRNQGCLYTTVWSAGNYMIQRWIAIDTTWGSYQRHYSNGVWQAWTPVYDGNNATTDPSNGGLMSLTTVSGFTVFKYLNGQMCLTGPIPTSPTIAANVNGNFDLTIPSVFNANFAICPTPALSASTSYDFSGASAFQVGFTTIKVFVRNGATAQTFNGNIVIWGRWK